MSNKITQFNKANLRELRTPITEALKAIETQFGVSIRLGNASFTPNNVTFKLELATVGADGTAVTKEANDLKLYGHMFGLPKDALGQTFKEGTKTFEIVGLRTRASRFPVLVKQLGGKTFCYPADRVEAALKLRDLIASGQ